MRSPIPVVRLEMEKVDRVPVQTGICPVCYQKEELRLMRGAAILGWHCDENGEFCPGTNGSPVGKKER